MATTKDKHEHKDDAKVEAKVEAKPDPGLVRMVKGDDELAVHPSCVKAHEGVGWRVA